MTSGQAANLQGGPARADEAQGSVLQLLVARLAILQAESEARLT